MADSLVTITVKFDPHRLSANQRIHWRERAKRAKCAKEAARAAWHCAGSPVIDGPVEVSLLVRRGRVIDPDNALGGFKACADALFNASRNGYGVTPDDSVHYVTWLPVRFETGDKWVCREEVVVSVRPLETT
jgi:hypothetical protein